MIKGKHIHKFFHWVIMTLLLTFPILMVGISTFGKESQTIDVTETYEFETNEVANNDVDELIAGNIYHFTFDITGFTNYNFIFDVSNFHHINITSDTPSTFLSVKTPYTQFTLTNIDNNATGTGADRIIFTFVDFTYDTTNYYGYRLNLSNGKNYHIEFDAVYHNYLNYSSKYDYKNLLTISQSDYLGEKNVDYVIHNEDYKQDVNNWINGFLNLPINAWYRSLMNVIGVGFTNSTVMNVIYVMPVYIIWVFIFDLVVDCFLVLIRLPHKLLNRLSGGENE